MTAKFIQRIHDETVSDEAIEEARKAFVYYFIAFEGTYLEQNQVSCLYSIVMRELWQYRWEIFK